MKKLLFLALFGIAIWQGSKHYPEVMHPAPSHEALVENRTGRTIVRLRLTVGGQTFVKEVLEPREVARFPFRVNRDASFDLGWQWRDAMGDASWHGGLVPQGPNVQRYRITIDPRGGVFYRAEPIAAAP